MRKAAIFLCLLFLLGACNIPLRGIEPALALTNEPTVTITPTIPYESCGWAWASQPLPDLSAQVQAALEAAGLEGVTARAEAFGENCLSQTNEILYFATMQTDFRVQVEVGDLSDTAGMGDLLERILIVLDGFPPGATPGPNPGYIGVGFTSGPDILNLWFPVTEGESARALGLHGAALFEELLNR